MRTTMISSPDLWSPLGGMDIVNNRALAHAFREWAHILFESRSATVPLARGEGWMAKGKEVAIRADLCSVVGAKLLAYTEDITSRKVYWATVEVKEGNITTFDGVYEYGKVDPYWAHTPLGQYGLSDTPDTQEPAERFLLNHHPAPEPARIVS